MTGRNENIDHWDPDHAPGPDDLARACAAVRDLIINIGPEQWAAPTPCSEWDVRRLVAHLTGMNRVFVALLNDEPIPRPPSAVADVDAIGAFEDSAAALQAVFDRPGALERTYVGPLGTATGAERLQIRLYDLLAHGWDLAQATGQPAALPEDWLNRRSPLRALTWRTKPVRGASRRPSWQLTMHLPSKDWLLFLAGLSQPTLITHRTALTSVPMENPGKLYRDG